MFFTIEPMIDLGRPETKLLADDWTAVTRDQSLSAPFEHSIGATADGSRSSRSRPRAGPATVPDVSRGSSFRGTGPRTA